VSAQAQGNLQVAKVGSGGTPQWYRSYSFLKFLAAERQGSHLLDRRYISPRGFYTNHWKAHILTIIDGMSSSESELSNDADRVDWSLRCRALCGANFQVATCNPSSLPCCTAAPNRPTYIRFMRVIKEVLLIRTSIPSKPAVPMISAADFSRSKNCRYILQPSLTFQRPLTDRVRLIASEAETLPALPHRRCSAKSLYFFPQPVLLQIRPRHLQQEQTAIGEGATHTLCRQAARGPTNRLLSTFCTVPPVNRCHQL
jgi:hypothetical protein